MKNSGSRRPTRHASPVAAPQLMLGGMALGGMIALARCAQRETASVIDRRARRLALSPPIRRLDGIMWPLFPLGLPGGYIGIAYVTAHKLHCRRRRGGPAIVTSAWLGWLAHRAAKLVYTRERPRRPGVKRRYDSYPSGHTTGATALALTTAYVLRRENLISLPVAVAIASVPPAVMGVYRVIDDEHWATDVLGGWMLGAAIGLTCNAVLADAVGGAAHYVRGAVTSPRVIRRRDRPASAKSAAAAGRADSPGDRADTARPSVR